MTMAAYSVDPQAVTGMASAVGACVESVPAGVVREADGCGSAAVEAAAADFAVWARVTWNEAKGSLADLSSAATNAAAEYASADDGAASASKGAGS